MRARRATLAVAGAAALALLPGSWLEHEMPRATAAIEAPKALAAIAICLLCVDRFQRLREAWALTLAGAAGAAGAVGAVAMLLPDVTGSAGTEVLRAQSVSLALMAAGLCSVAALLAGPHRWVLESRRDSRRWVLRWGLALALLAGGHLWLTSHGQTAIETARLGEAAALAVAAAVLADRRRHSGPAFLGWLAVGAGLAAAARFHAALLQPAATDWLTSSQLLAGASRGVIIAALVAALREEQAAARRRAIIDEQRRIARELHDGLASLALVMGQARWLARRSPDHAGPLEDLAEAAEHALEQTRSAVRGLSSRAASSPLAQVTGPASQPTRDAEPASASPPDQRTPPELCGAD